MKFFSILIFFLFIFFPVFANETWVLDKNLSTIKFEIPIILANNVKGEFEEIHGLIEIDLDNNNNNKAIFSVEINSITMNYMKYKTLLLSNIFFDVEKFPIALIDTKKFDYQNEKFLELNAELLIKGITKTVPLILQIIPLAEELVQIKGKLKFSRTTFEIGKNEWVNTAILKDEVSIFVNLFLFKK